MILKRRCLKTKPQRWNQQQSLQKRGKEKEPVQVILEVIQILIILLSLTRASEDYSELFNDFKFYSIGWFADPVEGFSVFNSSKTESVLAENEETELVSQRKKEFNRQMEVCFTQFTFSCRM